MTDDEREPPAGSPRIAPDVPRISLPGSLAHRGALILDVEAWDVHYWHLRARVLEAAEFAIEHVDGAAAARARRLQKPYPNVVIVCRCHPGSAPAIREAEREADLPRVPMIMSGGVPVEWLLDAARAADADAVVEVHVVPMALVEVVLRVGWPEEFAAAYFTLHGILPPETWPKGSARVTAAASPPPSPASRSAGPAQAGAASDSLDGRRRG